ncbi:MAG: ATP-binding protein [Acidobacteriota bacterium]
MKQEILLEEIKKFLDNSARDSLLKNPDTNMGPYPDILPVILHKLKNKLTPILGYSQILQMKNSDDILADKINKIEKNAVELTELFDNLKDSLIIKKPTLTKCNLNELIMSEGKLFRAIRENGIRIVPELDKHLPLIPVNTRQVSLLIQNVLQNSLTGIVLKVSENGEIRISTGQTEDGIFLKIRDNGSGIEPSDINNIWTPFFSRFPGRGGIGLLIAEKVMSDHKGKYSVESETGVFTEFTFEFPFKETKTTEKSDPDLNVLFAGFTKEEIEIIEKVAEDNKAVHIKKAGITDLAEEKINKSTGLIFINQEITGSEENRELLQKITDETPDTEFVMFHSGGFPEHLIDIFIKDNVRVVPDRTKLLTIINILATAINKEE